MNEDMCPHCQEMIPYDPYDYAPFPCPVCEGMVIVYHDAVVDLDEYEVPVHGLEKAE